MPVRWSDSGKYEIVSDFPLQGSSQHQTTQMNQAIEMMLKQANYKAGNVTVQFQPCDDSTAAGRHVGLRRHARRTPTRTRVIASVIGVIGTFNSGCAELEIPVLNQARAARSPWSARPTRGPA